MPQLRPAIEVSPVAVERSAPAARLAAMQGATSGSTVTARHWDSRRQWSTAACASEPTPAGTTTHHLGVGGDPRLDQLERWPR